MRKKNGVKAKREKNKHHKKQRKHGENSERGKAVITGGVYHSGDGMKMNRCLRKG